MHSFVVIGDFCHMIESKLGLHAAFIGSSAADANGRLHSEV